MSANSDVDICNRGLLKVGQRQIMSLDDNSREARECKRLYTFARDMLQRLYLWNFCKKRASLAALSGTPDGTDEWERHFALPSDFLRLIDVRTHMEWTLEGNTIITNAEAPLKIIYSAKIEDTTKFDSIFVELLSSYIAVELTEIFTQDRLKRESLYAEFRATLAQAKATDAKEQHPLMLEESEWITSRW